MKLGTILPISALSEPPEALADFARQVEAAGLDFIGSGGHTLAAPPGRFEGRPAELYSGPFLDPFILFSFLAGQTSTLSFFTTITISPALPTALIARQAADLNRLSGGRFSLGLGISWNQPEYEALGQTFERRGDRLEEQIQVLRLLWTEPFVAFEGEFHKLEGMGLGPAGLPSQPIPIWIGCSSSDRLLRRVARLADGWLALERLDEPAPRLRAHLVNENRQVEDFGLAAMVSIGSGGPAKWIERAERQAALGANHLLLAPPAESSLAELTEALVEASSSLAAALD